jgi:hypothetical protein
MGTMLKDMYGIDFDKNALAQKISKSILATNNKGDEVNITVFQVILVATVLCVVGYILEVTGSSFQMSLKKDFVKTHPAMLYPAFSMQDRVCPSRVSSLSFPTQNFPFRFHFECSFEMFCMSKRFFRSDPEPSTR